MKTIELLLGVVFLVALFAVFFPVHRRPKFPADSINVDVWMRLSHITNATGRIDLITTNRNARLHLIRSDSKF